MLTPAQLIALRNDVFAAVDAPTVDARLRGDTLKLAEIYNAPATPAFIAWKTRVEQEVITQNGFDWVRVDNLSVGKARIWEWMFDNPERSINPSKANVRAGIEECWKGTAADLAVRAAVLAHCKRNTTRAERLFAVGAGTDVDPSTMSFEGNVTQSDMQQVLAG